MERVRTHRGPNGSRVNDRDDVQAGVGNLAIVLIDRRGIGSVSAPYSDTGDAIDFMLLLGFESSAETWDELAKTFPEWELTRLPYGTFFQELGDFEHDAGWDGMSTAPRPYDAGYDENERSAPWGMNQ